jgi:Sec-independent protein translocase protein TatA
VDFLNVGPWELILVLIIAILVAGPKRMVEIARTLGEFSRQLRDLSREFTTALQAEIDATEREAGRAGVDLREVQRDLENVLTGSPEPRTDAPDADEVHETSAAPSREEE